MRKSIADWMAGARARDPSTLAAIGLAVLVLTVTLARAPRFLPDSAGYIDNWVIRPPVYPLLLDLLKAVFGEGFGSVAVLVQSSVAVLCIARFSGALRIHHGLGRPGASLVAAILLVPLLRYGPMIMPEALAYGFLLWFAALLFESVATRSPRSVVAASAVCALAVLTRNHSMYLLPVLAILLAGQLVFARGGQRRAMALAVGLSVALLIGQSVVQRTYHYFENDVFGHVSLSGLALMTVQLYLSDPGEIDYFEEGGEPRRLLSSIYPILDERRVRRQYTPKGMPDSGWYQFSFDQIAYFGVLAAYRADRSIPSTADMKAADWIELNEISMAVTRELVLRHPGRYAAHMVRELYQTGRFFFLLVALLPPLAAGLWIRSRDAWWAAVGLVGLAACADWASTVLTHSIMIRYTYAADSLVLVAIVASLVRAAEAAPRASDP